MAVAPPPSLDNNASSVAWKDWLYKFQVAANTQNHNDLNNIQGGSAAQRYHLTELQWEQSASWRNLATEIPVAMDPDKTGAGPQATPPTYPFVLSNNNLTITVPASFGQVFNPYSTVCNTSVSGKRYFEIDYTGAESSDVSVGLVGSAFDWTDFSPGVTTCGCESWGYKWVTGTNDRVYYDGSIETTFFTGGFRTGSTYMIAVDTTAQKWWIGKDGVWLNSGDPGGTGLGFANITNPLVGTLYPAFGLTKYLTLSDGVWTMVFSASDFTYSPPTGFGAIPSTFVIQDDTFLIPADGGDSYTLPTGVSWNGRLLAVKKVDELGVVTVTAGGGDTIDGGASVTLTNPFESIILQKNNLTWQIISSYIDSDVTFADSANFSKRYTLLLS